MGTLGEPLFCVICKTIYWTHDFSFVVFLDNYWFFSQQGSRKYSWGPMFSLKYLTSAQVRVMGPQGRLPFLKRHRRGTLGEWLAFTIYFDFKSTWNFLLLWTALSRPSPSSVTHGEEQGLSMPYFAHTILTIFEALCALSLPFNLKVKRIQWERTQRLALFIWLRGSPVWG